MPKLTLNIKKWGRDYIMFNHKNQFRFVAADSLLANMRKLVKVVDPTQLISMILSEFNRTYHLDIVPISEINPKISSQDFSDYDKELIKKLFKYPLVYPKFGNKYNNVLSSARYILTSGLQTAFDVIISHINPNWSEGTYMTYVKDLGTYILEKVINQNYPLYCLNFVEIHMLSGYDTYFHRKFNIAKDVLPFSQERYLSPYLDAIFKRHIANTINNISFAQHLNCNFDDFVRYRDNWNIMGSATLGIPMKIKTAGFHKASRVASKTTNLLYYSDEELLKQLYRFEGHEIRPFLKKDEPAKARVVIGYDTRSYIRCTYLEQFIDQFNGKEKWTTVGDTPETLYAVRERINDNIYSGKYRMICTDQSAFDQHQYKHLFIYAFNQICDHIERLNPQVKTIRELENYGMAHAYILLPDGKRLPWKNGLLSGHKFTALIGSILNRAATLTALELSRCSSPFSVFQGDDALLFMPKDLPYENFLKAYSTLDLVVNPMKSWHGLDRTEYLHQVYIRDQVIALSMRACLGLFFKKPGSLEVAPDQWFLSNLDQFRMARRRGLDVDKLALTYIRHFLKKYTNLSFRDLTRDSYNYLHTPTLYGGAGFEPYIRPPFYRKLSFEKTEGDVGKSEIISPYHYVLAGDKELTSKWILKKIYAHLPAPGIQTKCRVHKIDFTTCLTLPTLKPTPDKFYYDPDLKDNTSRWYNHCLSVLNLTCIYGPNGVTRFSRIRSRISDSFNLISNITNSFLGYLDKKIWNRACNSVLGIYTVTRVSMDRCLAYLESYRKRLFYQYRTTPPPWYNYGFYF